MNRRAFSLVELLVAISVTAMLVVLLVNLASSAANAWQRGEAQAESFSGARGALTQLNRELQGSVVDLDMGFRISPTGGGGNNFRLTFLTRHRPEADEPAAEKISYELAWAEPGLDPKIVPDRDSSHPVPVLVRTVSTDLTDVFDVPAGEPGAWAASWPDLAAPGPGDITEVLADHVLGWRIEPIEWVGDDTTGSMRVVSADDENAADTFDRYLTSRDAPSALRVRIAVLPARQVSRLESGFSEQWASIRDQANLFDMEDWADTPFFNLLRQSVRYFETTITLQSRTP